MLSGNDYTTSSTWNIKQKVLPQFPCVSGFEDHRLVRLEGNQKQCFLCHINKVRTSAGYRVYTRVKCGACDLPLCKDRKCFYVYHRLLAEGKSLIYMNPPNAVSTHYSETEHYPYVELKHNPDSNPSFEDNK
ncbi:hypothetical protein KUTeg_023004 [Tegillarca granosa]|uniref:PiggyBac transposable element-derived protein 4 C-terminal zinc-finger domain-containing protein n=1 Tax=Tegillarca granosa TaxID=220873 RepID=A0ABQ9E0U0_TEGGR|nr:hypothetical protein KUTeg_023004 [Tegillarca granosa]